MAAISGSTGVRRQICSAVFTSASHVAVTGGQFAAGLAVPAAKCSARRDIVPVAAGRYRDALRHRDFRRLAVAFLIDQIGGWAYNVVLIVWVFDRTHSPSWVAATTASGWVPRLLWSAYAGV